MNASAFNAGINARAKVNATATNVADRAVGTAKYFGGAAKFAGLSTASFVKGFFTAKPVLEAPEPTVTLTERELSLIVEQRAAELSTKPRARRTKK
jgi:hypothetical protein